MASSRQYASHQNKNRLVKVISNIHHILVKSRNSETELNSIVVEVALFPEPLSIISPPFEVDFTLLKVRVIINSKFLHKYVMTIYKTKQRR